MAHLLGRQDCVESLRKDLIDLQGTVLDVFSRTGPVCFASWKFPDKLSCNLDLVSLLDQYDFVDGEDEFNQHAHIVLLELVIDRLLLLLQSFNAHAEKMRIGQRIEHLQQTSPCVSIGLVVRYYWNNLIQLVNQQGMTKDSQKVTKPTKHEEIHLSPAPSVTSCGDLRVGPPSSGKTNSVHCVGMPTNQVSGQSSSAASRAALPHNTTPVSSDTHSVSCQTVESCLVPCDACAHVQSSLRETADALVELCRTEGLPSSLQRLLVAVDDTWAQGRLTAGDLAQWSTEQRRDMGRLGKHLQEVRATVQPLRDGLQAAEGELERFKAQLQRAQEELQRERENYQASTQQQQQKLLEAQTSWVETERRLQEEQKQLRRGTVSLEDSNSKLKVDISLLHERLRILESERNKLHEEVKSLRKEEDTRHELEEKTHTLESQLSSTQLLLDKESAKYQSACRQQESMQAKQGSLLERVDALDQECEELQNQLGEGEDRQTDLQEKLQHISEERTKVQAQLIQQQALCSELQEQKQKLEAYVGDLTDSVTKLRLEVKELAQRERLLVAFPELSSAPQGPPQSTGDVLRDMEQQLHANSVRIRVLERENTTLHSTLTKLRPRPQHGAPEADSSAVSHTPVVSQQVPTPHGQPSPLQTTSTGQWRRGLSGNGASEPPVVVGPWDHAFTAASSASPSPSASPSASPSSTAQLRHQTLILSPDTSAAKTYSKIRQASQARANAMHTKRK